jgi:hypothetical protein
LQQEKSDLKKLQITWQNLQLQQQLSPEQHLRVSFVSMAFLLSFGCFGLDRATGLHTVRERSQHLRDKVGIDRITDFLPTLFRLEKTGIPHHRQMA